MKWWCSASTAPWDWTWKAYPGIWLVILTVLLGYVRLRKSGAGSRHGIGHTVAFALGLMSLWVALDWPLGALAAGYLISAHTVQYLLLDFVAAPLLLLGVPRDAWQRPPASGWIRAALRAAARPLFGLVVYNGIVVATHLPAVSDPLMARQLGNMAIDLSWLLAGLALWWPVIAPPDFSRLQPPLKMGYLFASTIIPTAPAAFLTFAEYPLFSVFELAPRVNDIEALKDQQTAGIMMKLAADPFIWLAMGVIFFRWSAEADREERDRRAAISRPASTRG